MLPFLPAHLPSSFLGVFLVEGLTVLVRGNDLRPSATVFLSDFLSTLVVSLGHDSSPF